MNKANIDSFESKLKSAGIDKYTIRFEGGNRSLFVNSESCRIKKLGDYIIALETDQNYGVIGSNFNITMVEYDLIDSVTTRGLNVKEALDVLAALGADDDEMKELIALRGSGAQPPIINASNAGLEDYRDEEGKQTLDNQIAARVTMLAPQNEMQFKVETPEDISDPGVIDSDPGTLEPENPPSPSGT